MDTQAILESLYADYQAIVQDWESALQELWAADDALKARQRQLDDLEANREVMEASIILAETHEKGRINGSNAEKRKKHRCSNCKRVKQWEYAEKHVVRPDGHQLTTSLTIRNQVPMAQHHAFCRTLGS